MMLRITEEILADTEWRNRELENTKKIGLVTLSTCGESIQREYFRMCIPYIYAHWEGFTIETFSALIDYMNKLNIQRSNIRTELQTFSLMKEFRSLSGKQSFSDCQAFNDKYLQLQCQSFYIDRKQFSTNSNLNYDQLEKILHWFGMKNVFEKHKFDINQLVHLRNRIAHGENGINVEYQLVEKNVSLLHELFDAIVLLIDDYVRNQKFLVN